MRAKTIFTAMLFIVPLAICLPADVGAQTYWDRDVPVSEYMLMPDGGGIRGHGGNNRPPGTTPAEAAILDALEQFISGGVPNYEEFHPKRIVTNVYAVDYDLIPLKNGEYDCLLFTVDIQYKIRKSGDD